MIEINFANKEADYNNIALLIDESKQISPNYVNHDEKFNSIISHALAEIDGFEGKLGQSKLLKTIGANGTLMNIILIGCGNISSAKENDIEEIGGVFYNSLLSIKAKSGQLLMCGFGSVCAFSESELAALIASGIFLASYRFDKYKTGEDVNKLVLPSSINIITQNIKAAEESFSVKCEVAKGVFCTRDLVSEVPNILYPDSYAERIVSELEPLGIEVEVLGEAQMHALGMGALLGVGQGSAKESKLVIMKYNNSSKQKKPVCFVGKGVTFDTGGISLKPAANMHQMKYDMGGSASVVGTMYALAARSAKVNAVGIVGLVENMPGGNAQRPGDVVKTMSGKYAEVLNTDAEGRLVLADCLTYAQRNFEPECIIDLATLTGAIVVALGYTYGGCFSNDETLAQNLINAGNKADEKLWRMPLHKDYSDMIKSSVADVANLGSERGMAGSSTAAEFLKHFIENDTKWAHLDIAGMAWTLKKSKNIYPVGASGYGVRLLNQFIKDNYEF